MLQVKFKMVAGETIVSIIVSRICIFHITWVLQNSSEVSEFMVYDCDIKENPKSFGFGPMDKWVQEFTFNQEV